VLSMVKIIFTVTMTAVALSACASTSESRQTSSATDSNEKLSKAKVQVTEVATTPLSDLNLVHGEIPPVLLIAQKAPYSSPLNQTCEGIMYDVAMLNAVLGADLDVPEKPSPGLVERGTVAAGNAAVGVFRGAAEGIVPYRSWVRKLTGAERYSKDVADAIAAGTVRRAFLKGFARATGCDININIDADQPALNRELSSEAKSVTTMP
jgi:hypothetical protein